MVRRSNILSTVIGTLVLVFICIGIQYSSQMLSWVFANNIDFVRKDLVWTADLTGLAPGEYFISIGRPRGLCEVYIGSKILDSTKSIRPNIRGKLLFGGSFSHGVNSPNKLHIECKKIDGFNTSLMHPPVIMPYFSGVLLQQWRGFTELMLGPFFAMFLLLTLIVMRISRNKDVATNFGLYFFFAATAFIYSLSLSYYTRLFIDGLSASILHVVLRMMFHLGFLLVVGSYSRHQKVLLSFGGLSLIATCVIGVFSPNNLQIFDNITFLYYPLSTFIYLMDLRKSVLSTRVLAFLQLIIFARLLTQIIDLSIIWFNVGVYLAPSALALKTTMLLILKFKDDQSRVRQAEASKELLRTLNSNLTIQQMLSEMAKIAFKETSFGRLSAYVDSFTVGRNDRPFQKMNRIIEIGYRKDTQADLVVNFDEDRGLKMKEAIDSGNIMMNFGDKDGAHYVNLPLGKHACLNFSNDEPCPTFKAHESFEILTALYPALSSVNERIVNYGMKQGAALQKLRSVRGDGAWQEQIGLIFVDINDYSTLADRYGPSFGEFVSAKYLPALCRYVGSWALREFSRGDEIYLVCIKDMLEDGVLPHQAVPTAIEKIIEFVSQEGKDLCLSSGFSPLVVSIAAGFGEAAIVCDQMEVRTSGEIVNETHRLLSASPVGTIILHKNLVDILSSDGKIYKGSDVPVLVKKNLVLGRILDRKLSA